MKKAATIIYAVGWTQHTSGTQIIRTAAILQLLLGNVGRAGGGVNALARSLQHSGRDRHGRRLRYLPRLSEDAHTRRYDLATFLKRTTPTPSKPDEWDSYNYWSNTPKFMVVVPEGALRRCSEEGERLRLSLSAQDRSQVLMDRDVGRHVRRAKSKACLPLA